MSSVAIVTGASQNIGAAIAQRFSDSHLVLIADVQEPKQRPNNSYYLQTDITDEASVARLFDFLAQQGLQAKTLINNAGITIEAPFADTELHDWQRVLQVNTTGSFIVAKAFIQYFRQQRQGESMASIVNIGSIEALAANPTHAAYAASKGAIHSFTQNIAIDHGKDGIRANAIAPGWINTSFNQALIERFADPQKALTEVLDLHPLGKLGSPEDVANLAYFLASDEAQFINGQIISIDGGRNARLPLPKL